LGAESEHKSSELSTAPTGTHVEEKPVAGGRWIMRKQRIVKEDGRILIYYDFESPDHETRDPQPGRYDSK